MCIYIYIVCECVVRVYLRVEIRSKRISFGLFTVIIRQVRLLYTIAQRSVRVE